LDDFFVFIKNIAFQYFLCSEQFFKYFAIFIVGIYNYECIESVLLQNWLSNKFGKITKKIIQN